MTKTKTKANPKVEAQKETLNEKNPSDDILSTSIGKGYTSVLTIGTLPDGRLDVNSTHPNFPAIHYLLNKTVLEMLIVERELAAQKAEEDKA